MRVTGKMIRDKVLYNVNLAQERLQLGQTQMATGKRILKPSDDPLGLSKSLGFRALRKDNEQFQRNIGDALAWIDNTEPEVEAMVEILAELKEIAVEGASDTKSAAERSVLAGQVEGLIERLVELANSTYGGRYVFAGTYTTTKPYDIVYSAAAESVSLPDLEWVDLGNAQITQGSVTVTGMMGEGYTEGVDFEIDYALGRIRRLAGGAMVPGDTYNVSYDTDTASGVVLNVPDTSGAINREVAAGVHNKINFGGEEILDSGIDIFGLLISVKNDLARNRGAAVSASLDDIEAGLDQIAAVLGQHGIRRNAFELAKTRLESEMVNLEALISELEDADMAEVAVAFQTDQLAYESALAAASRIVNTSLVNFIG
jgi:flagellar hook-associated protein 3 FlgL